MNSESYWARRIEEREAQWYKKSQETIEKELAQYYEQALFNIQNDIAILYGRFAKDNQLSITDAFKLLTGNEFRIWRKSMQDYINEYDKTQDNKILLEINTLAMRSRISRLDKVYADTLKELHSAGVKIDKSFKSFLIDAYKDNYYKNLYDIGQKASIKSSIAEVDSEDIKKVLKTPWSGKNYSQRIWQNTDKLSKLIKDEIVNGVHRGVSINKMAKLIEQRMNVGKYEATRLVRTELNYVQNQSTLDSIKDSEMKYYIFLATLDKRTSDICRSHDHHIYPVDEAKAGSNMPPLHPNCRSTISGSLKSYNTGRGKRIGKDAEGKRVTVPASMDYDDFYKIYIEKSKTLVSWRKEQWKKSHNYIIKNPKLPNHPIETKNIKKLINEATTIQEINDIALKELKSYGIVKYDMTGINLDLAKRNTLQLIKLQKQYKNDLVEIQSPKEIDNGTNPGATIRIGAEKTAIIQLPLKYYSKNIKRYIKLELNNIKDNTSHKIDASDFNLSIATLTHEFGHTFSSYRQYKQYGFNSDFWKEILSIRRKYNKALKNIKKRRIVLKEISYDEAQSEKAKIFISKYADTNPDEFLAEAFLVSNLSSKPSPYAIQVLKVVDKYFLRQKPQKDDILNLDDFMVPKSVGAMAKKFYVKSNISLKQKEWYIKPGTQVTGVKAIAIGEKIREVKRLIRENPLSNGTFTEAKDWMKVRGTAIITDGKTTKKSKFIGINVLISVK